MARAFQRWTTGRRDAITDVRGIKVGHWTDRRRGTGCTVILCEEGMAAAVDVRGGAPGTRETDVLALPNLVRQCHGIALCGGSAFGLAAAQGVMDFLREKGAGYGTAITKVPIVPAAVVFDLSVGKQDAAPGPEEGFRAAARATGGRVAQGTVGVGTGTTVAKLLGGEYAIKAGVGTASFSGPRGITVGALVVNNAVGTILDVEKGRIIAGPRGRRGRFIPFPEALSRRTEKMAALSENTTLAVVATNANLEPTALQRISYAAHDGLARAIFPSHTLGDGDTAFAITNGSMETEPYDALTVHVLAQKAVEIALLRSVTES
ncbi:MAG TPA: P1 family peptidase, partial [Dehalococcoidia bacterium]|nr:P1 family peptidase [Dehalococcoidia bacterium]